MSILADKQEVLNALKNRPANATGEFLGGMGDPSIDFGNGESFYDEKTGSITIAIDGSQFEEDKKIAICPGYYALSAHIKDENGRSVDAIIADGVLLEKGKVSCTPIGISDTLGYLFSNATRLIGIKVSVDDAEQLDKPLYYRGLSPFKNLGDDRITPAEHKSENQQNDKIATMDTSSRNWILGSNSVLLYTVGAGRKVTITLSFGASVNATKELQVKAAEARKFFIRRAAEGKK